MVLLVFIRCIVIYPVDSAIHRLNNWLLVLRECRLAIENTTHNILDMKKGLIVDYGLQHRDTSNKNITGICDNLKESFSNRRRNKLDKLCDIIQTDNQDKHLADTKMRIREILDKPLAPSCSQIVMFRDSLLPRPGPFSQIDRFLTDVRVEVDNKENSNFS